MRKLLHSTTSITLCMALVVPGITPTFAAAQTAACGAPGEETTFPCVLADGTEVTSEAELQSLSPEQNTTEQATEAPQDEASDGAAATADEATAAQEAEAAQAAETEAEAAKQAEEQAAADAAAQAEQEAAAAAEAKQEAAAAAQAEQEAVAAAAQAEEQNAAEAAAQAEESAAAETAAETEQQKAADAAAQAEEDVAKQAAELEKALKDEQAATAQAEEEAKEAQTAGPADTAAPAETTAPEASATPPQTEQAAEQPVDEEARAARQAERQAARRAERQAEREAAREALEQEPAGDVTTEEVTIDDTRRSDQDFETSATGSEEATKDDGLSNLEKALLLGLGAAVVGTILKNGDKVVSNSGDRVVVQDETGDLRVLKDDDALLRRPGDEVRTETFNDGSTRQIVEKPNGSRIVTIRSSDGTVLRRISVDENGNETTLFDDLADEREVVVSELPQIRERSFAADQRSEEDLRAALIAQQRAEQDRSFSLRQVREIERVRALAPPIELDAARFATGSAAIAPEQARSLARVGNTLRDMIAEDPRTVFLIEGHTDAVGDATYNLALSDRRAETVALALTEYFDVPPENMVTQGYGESALKVQTSGAEQANRRAVVRNITGLLRQASN